MATTTNYSWTTPDDTDLVKDGASAIRALGTAIDTTVFTNAGEAIAKSLVDAKGDLIVATADNTVTRLAVGGTNDHVLTVDSSTATGLKWAAAAGGGFTSIATGSLSSTSVVISAISQSYKHLYLRVENPVVDTGSPLTYRLNGSSSSIYASTMHEINTTTWVKESAQSQIEQSIGNYNLPTTARNFTYTLQIENYALTNYKNITHSLRIDDSNGSGALNGASSFNDTTAITSITIGTKNGTRTFSAGTYTLFGVN